MAAFPKLKGRIGHCLFAPLFYSLLFILFFSPALLAGSHLGPLDSVFYHQPYFYAKKVLWDTLLLSGFPMMADPQVMAWYPPALLFSQLPGGWNFFIISAYVLASSFTYGYAYTLTQSRLAALTSGIVYGLSGFMAAQLDHASIIHCAAWLPLIIWSLEMLRRRASAAWFAIGCLAIACSNFAGHSQIFAYSLMLDVAYAAVLGWTAPTGRKRFYGLAALMIALGIGAASIQMLPTLELGSLSLRANLSFEGFTSYSLPPRQIVTIFFPALFGGLPAYGRAGYFGEWNLIELAGYVGLLPLMLAVVGFIASRHRALSIFWLCVGVLAFLLALGGATPLAFITYRIPALNLFRAQARHFFLMAFAVSVLSGFGIKAFLKGKVTRRLMLSMVVVMAAAMLVCLVILRLTQISDYAAQKGIMDWSLLPWRNRAIGIPSLIFLLSAAALAYWQMRPASNIRSMLLLLMVAIDLGSFSWFYTRAGVTSTDVLTPPAFVARYREALDAQHQRMLPPEGVLSPRNALPPNLSRMWAVPSASVYGPLILTRTSRLLSMSPAGVLDSSWQKGGDQSLNLLAIRYVFTPRLKPTEDLHGITWLTQDTEIALGKGCNTSNPLTARVDVPASYTATKIAIVSLLGCSTELSDGAEVLRISVTDVNGKAQTMSMNAGRDTSEWAHDCHDILPQVKHGRAEVFKSFQVDRGGEPCEGHEYLTILPLKEMDNLRSMELQWTGSSGSISIKKISLIDERAGQSFPVSIATGSISDANRWRHVEDIDDVSVYENLKAMPRAWLVNEVLSVNAQDALRIIKSSSLPDGRAFDPALVALVEEPLAFKADKAGAGGTAEVLSLSGSHIEVRTVNAAASFLVLSDVYYPGWKATIDGAAAHLYETDFVLRGVEVPAGSHVVKFEFRPASFYYGLLVSALSVLIAGFVVFKLRIKGGSV